MITDKVVHEIQNKFVKAEEEKKWSGSIKNIQLPTTAESVSGIRDMNGNVPYEEKWDINSAMI